MAVVADGTSYFDRPEKRTYDEGANDISWKVGWSRPASWLEPMPELPMYSRCSSGNGEWKIAHKLFHWRPSLT